MISRETIRLLRIVSLALMVGSVVVVSFAVYSLDYGNYYSASFTQDAGASQNVSFPHALTSGDSLAYSVTSSGSADTYVVPYFSGARISGGIQITSNTTYTGTYSPSSQGSLYLNITNLGNNSSKVIVSFTYSTTTTQALLLSGIPAIVAGAAMYLYSEYGRYIRKRDYQD
ncbi:MAG: hypothetical protein M1148_00605 [Candidatus Thermoplasmatota archaeon]|nr:hypothetical protein [Candidatus Thermoplasmatota archaeon]MCL5437683.1 hypothetical protein [Candidatus Thermoplasmatota archaeon]